MTKTNQELAKFINGWLVEVSFGVYDREDLPKIADKMLKELQPLIRSATNAKVEEAIDALGADEADDGENLIVLYYKSRNEFRAELRTKLEGLLVGHDRTTIH